MMRPEYKVCGGTFLYVILLAISAKARRRGLNNEGIKESTCFMDMIKLGMRSRILSETNGRLRRKRQSTSIVKLNHHPGCHLHQRVI